MHGRHPEHRGNEKKANVGGDRAKDNSVSNVTTKKLHISTTRSMITIDSCEKNNNRNRHEERTNNISTGLSLGTKRLGGV
jgi:hypothetical protein